MRVILQVVVGLTLIGLPAMSSATTGTGGIPTILQRVRIGDAPLAPNTGMSPPIALVHPRPAYTTAALQAGIEGTVTVKAEFDIDGRFEVLEVVDSLGYGLDEAALAALETWTFRPAYRSGRRVPVVANIDVEFRSPGIIATSFVIEAGQLEALESLETDEERIEFIEQFWIRRD